MTGVFSKNRYVRSDGDIALSRWRSASRTEPFQPSEFAAHQCVDRSEHDDSYLAPVRMAIDAIPRAARTVSRWCDVSADCPVLMKITFDIFP